MKQITDRPEFKICPFCGEDGKLTKSNKKLTKIKGNKVVTGIFEIWTCEVCGEGFTHKWDFETKEIPPTDKA